MENINSYLHYYLDQKCKVDSIDRIGRLVAIDIAERTAEVKYITGNNIICHIENVKMVLKKLSDMTEEDAERLIRMKWPKSYLSSPIKEIKISSFAMEGLIYSELYSDWHQVIVLYESLNPAQFHYLISKGYWLWDEEAFTSGLILDAKNVK